MKKRISALTVALTLVLCMCFGGGCANNSGVTPDSGNKQFDATKLPYYTEDISSLSYSYTNEERLRPFWLGNVMYNEQLMVVKKDGVTQGKLLYTPTRVISVRDWSLNKEYAEGVDYLIDGNTITLPEGSSIPVFCDEWSRGENIPADYPFGNAGTGWQFAGDGTVMYTETGLTWQHYIHVTYAYNPADVDRSVFTDYSGALYRLSEKITSDTEDKNLKMVVFGDSISEGCSSSQKWNHAPMCPPYAELVKEGLETFGGLNVDFTNISVGGKDSVWAASDEQLNKITSLVP